VGQQQPEMEVEIDMEIEIEREIVAGGERDGDRSG